MGSQWPRSLVIARYIRSVDYVSHVYATLSWAVPRLYIKTKMRLLNVPVVEILKYLATVPVMVSRSVVLPLSEDAEMLENVIKLDHEESLLDSCIITVAVPDARDMDWSIAHAPFDVDALSSFDATLVADEWVIFPADINLPHSGMTPFPDIGIEAVNPPPASRVIG